eukprot:TRINITY_DN108030_c0_g1_i1.p1 TRINITY_DN108030_c0_g1~~TRINITY_DN108030_c0_g1_i1.p1  ORF type:complete len:683 (-),score=98.08 TRINITY_DN108030_c0_g1_i1:241-2106(-)
MRFPILQHQAGTSDLHTAYDDMFLVGDGRTTHNVRGSLLRSTNSLSSGAQPHLKDCLTPKEEFSYLKAMQRCAAAGNITGAAALLQQLIDEGVVPTIKSYNAVIKACAQAKNPRAAEKWLNEMNAFRVEPDRWSYNFIIHAHAVAGNMKDAIKWFETLERDLKLTACAASYNALLWGYSQQQDLQGATRLFDQMTGRHVEPNIQTYNAMIQVCAQAGKPEAAEHFFQSAVKAGLEPTGHSYADLIWAFNKAGIQEKAVRFYNRMLAVGVQPPIKTFRVMMQTCVLVKDAQGASEWFEKMLSSRVKPDLKSYTTMLKVWAERGDTSQVLMVMEHMNRTGIDADVYAYNALLLAYSRANDLDGTLQCYQRMQEAGPVPDSVSFRLAIKTLAKAGDANRASEWAKKMLSCLPSKGAALPLYDNVIQTLAHYGHADEAADWIVHARRAHVKPTLASYDAVMRVYLSNAKKTHNQTGNQEWAAQENSSRQAQPSYRPKSESEALASQWMLWMRGNGTDPELHTHIMFLRHAGEYNEAEACAALHDSMTESGIQPSAESFQIVLSAFARVDNQPKVLEWIERSFNAGYQPDAILTRHIRHCAWKGDLSAADDWLETLMHKGMRNAGV